MYSEVSSKTKLSFNVCVYHCLFILLQFIFIEFALPYMEVLFIKYNGIRKNE